MPKQLGYVVLFVIIFSAIQPSYAQTLPTPEDFDRELKACAARQNIGLESSIMNSISRLYASESARQALRSPAEFLLLIPEGLRIEAYRLYAECIMKIVPQLASTSPPSETRTYRVCTGEYARACQPHDTYLYCGSSVEAWAKERCISFQIRRLNTYGGNKCGYSLDEVVCRGPK